MRDDASVAAGPADLILRGGRVLVTDAEGSRAEAVAVSGGTIAAVGSDGEMDGWIGPCTRVIELAGRTVLPGINDSHLHGTHMGVVWPDVLFSDDPAESARVEQARIAGREDIVAAVRTSAEQLSRLGITSYTEPGIGPGEDGGTAVYCGSAALEVYREFALRGELRQRITLLGLYGTMDGPSSLPDVLAGIEGLARAGSDSDPRWLSVRGVKIFADLIPMMRLAWTRHAYDDGSHGGLLVVGSDLESQVASLREMVRAGHVAGLQVGVHATGDRTIQAVIDAVREAVAEPGATPAPELAHTIIHGDLVTGPQLVEMSELGMFLNAQPVIASAAGGMLAEVLGDEVAGAAWPLEAASELGVLALSSDAPMTSPDWRVGVARAEARMVAMGAATDAVSASERLHGLLRAYTAVPAAQDRAASWKGTVEAGKAADLVVLADDPHAVGAAGLPGVEIDATVLDGRIVFEREG